MDGCPERKLQPDPRVTTPTVELVSDAAGSRWVIRSFEAARQLLRSAEATRQAGFGADLVGRASAMRPPILYLEGPAHREQRKAAARLFAPKVVESYRALMEQVSARLLARLDRGRVVDLSAVSMRMAVEVAAQVIGLTNSRTAGLSRRLDGFFSGPPPVGKASRTPAGLVRRAGILTGLARFFVLDVKPAIRARRRRPREDVISQLLAAGFSDAEILTECLTYGAAGMATTRELMTMTAWHLLDDPDLLAQYRAAGRDGRLALVEETLRLEPVVGHLLRTTVEPVSVPTAGGGVVDLPVGSTVDVDLWAVNADAAIAGGQPYALCPGRALPQAVPPAVMSFGDGHHRCPGAPIAVMETEILLTALVSRDVVADGPPRVRWNPVSAGYDLDRFFVRVRS